jgi:hypothetical protein
MVRRVLLIMLLLCAVAQAQRVTLTYRGCEHISLAAVQGLSGITYAGQDQYYAVMDGSSTLVWLKIDCSGEGRIERASISLDNPLPDRRDYEGIAMGPGGESIFVCDESPAITQFALPPKAPLRQLRLPEIFQHIVRNQGFESLTVTPDGKTLWTANERALKIDGNAETPADPITSTTRVRLLRCDITPTAIEPNEQYEYQTSGVHDWGGQIGLCDLVALPDGRLLALERSAAKNFSGVVSIRTRIFLVDVTRAMDISRPPFDKGLVGHTPPQVRKTLLFDGFVCGEHGENLEGLCLGPRLGRSRWAVIGAVDSTDGGLNLSKSAIVSFELELAAAPEPRKPAMMPIAIPATVPATIPTTMPATTRTIPPITGEAK